MDHSFQALQLESISDNVFKLIEQDWMLITAGPPTHHNTMTANWGGLGNLWNRKVSFCFVRPQRYTYQFLEESPTFSLAFFAERYRPALELCGSRSGREINKAAASGLTPIEVTPGITSFAEARLVLECKKIYFQDINRVIAICLKFRLTNVTRTASAHNGDLLCICKPMRQQHRNLAPFPRHLVILNDCVMFCAIPR